MQKLTKTDEYYLQIADAVSIKSKCLKKHYGAIIVKSGGKVNAYGYIKGSGSLTLENGSSALDCMTNYDWPGGVAGSSMYKDVMPTNAWSLHNISCDTYIYAGATYSGYLHVTLTVPVLGANALEQLQLLLELVLLQIVFLK